MRQVVQYLGSGEIKVAEVPRPTLNRRSVLIRCVHSLVSSGTERNKVQTGNKSLLGKAAARPDLVRKVWQKVRTEGVAEALSTVRTRLSEASPMGYSVAGIVEAVGIEVAGIRPGDRVAAAGAGVANHADWVSVPANLVVKVPDGMALDEAAFGTIGAIALQGVRHAAPRLGDVVLVVGMGLIGQIAARLLVASGCRTYCTDIDTRLRPAAEAGGARWVDRMIPLDRRVAEETAGNGFDAVLICAATQKSELVNLCAEAARERGKVVIVGAVGLGLDREPFYMKEIDLVISRSYGPGRYDRSYEENGVDYPYAYVRYSEQRNIQAFLGAVSDGRVPLRDLISSRYSIDDAAEAYRKLVEPSETPVFGTIFDYPEAQPRPAVARAAPPPATRPSGGLRISFIGAGNYATTRILPALQRMPGVSLRRLATGTGLKAEDLKAKFGFAETVDDAEAVIGDADTDAVFVLTRHDRHAELAAAALRAGKHVFVEKPLAMTPDQLDLVRDAAAGSAGALAVGFNRRYAPLVQQLIGHFGGDCSDAAILMRINAGRLDRQHWLNDLDAGGGRIVGEVCHFVDLAVHLVGCAPHSVHAVSLSPAGAVALAQDVAVTLAFPTGAVAQIAYLATGPSDLPKEHIEVVARGRSVRIDDFRSALAHGGKSATWRGRGQDKGQGAMLEKVIAGFAGGERPMDPERLFASAAATLAVVESLATGMPVASATGA